MTVNRFVRRTPLAGEPVGREFSLNWGDQSLVRELRVWFVDDGESVAAFQVVWQTEAGSLLRSPILGQVRLGDDGSPVQPGAVTVLDGDDVVNGVYGTHGGGSDLVNSIGLITQGGGRHPLGWSAGDNFLWQLSDMPEDYMPNALVTGLYGRYDAAGLRAIGLRCTVDGVGPRLVRWGPGGRVVPAADAGKPPRVDHARVPAAPAEHPSNAGRLDHIGDPTPESARPNPNLVRVDVKRIDQWDDMLRIHSDDGAVSEYRYRGRTVDAAGEYWVDRYDSHVKFRYRRQSGAVDGGYWVEMRDPRGSPVAVHVEPDRAWIEVDESPRTVYVAPVAPPSAAADGPSWDNVFSLDHRVDYLAWAMRGLDVSRLAPFNLQESPGALQEEVFAGPQPGSRDFHIATNGKATVVPNGWKFVGDVAGSTKARTASSFSDEESRQTWATSLGISAEADALGAKVAYKNNSTAHAAVSNASAGKVVSTIVESMEMSHTLVVDLATVQLAPGFRHAVDELKTSPSTERIAEFIERFGTHFAHAVTFGSKNWEQRHETQESVTAGATTGSSQNQSVEAGYHGEVGGASGSVSWGADSEASASTKRGTGLDVSSSGSVGSAAEPVPIMLEVEDLTYLLSPVFFEDPQVHVDLRRAVERYLSEDFAAGVAFDYDDDGLDGLMFEVSQGAGPAPVGREGQAVRAEDDLGTIWWIRGGKRHRFATGEVGLLTFAGGGTEAVITRVELERFPDSGENVSIEGKVFSSEGDPSSVWWVGGGELHAVPSDVVIDVLGGWHMVQTVRTEAMNEFHRASAPTSIEGKMIRLADEDLTAGEAPVVWVIHGSRRHRISDSLGVRKRGGWQQVAVVRRNVFERYPDSGTPAL